MSPFGLGRAALRFAVTVGSRLSKSSRLGAVAAGFRSPPRRSAAGARGSVVVVICLVVLAGPLVRKGVGLLSPSALAAEAPTFQELEESLTCQCGCGLTVHSCNHLQCGSALPLRDEIRAQMKEGAGKEQILAHFSGKYGEKILSSPTTTGFNLAAWVTPFLMLLIGAAVVVFAVRRWGGPTAPTPPAAPRSPDAHREILERELREYKD